MNPASQTEPLVSVLLAAFNAEDTITRAVDCILNQTHRNLELLILDDGSTDATWDVISRMTDPRIRAVRQDENRGYLLTANSLADLAVGEYVTFQDADDWSAPNRIELLLRALRENPDAQIVSSNYRRVGLESTLVSEIPRNHAEISAAIKTKRKAIILSGTVLLPRELLKPYGAFYRDFFSRNGAEDVDWILRLLDAGHKFYCRPEPLYDYVYHDAAITANPYNPKLMAYFAYVFDLWDQRTQNGTDDLMWGDREKADQRVAELQQKYESDKGAQYRSLAYYKLQNGSYAQAVTNGLKAVVLGSGTKKDWRMLARVVAGNGLVLNAARALKRRLR